VKRCDDQGEHRIARGLGNGFVEGDVVVHDPVGIGEIGAHRSGEAGDLDSFTIAPPERGKLDGAHFNRAPDVEDLLNGDLVGLDDVVENQREDAGIHRRDPRTPAVADFDQFERCERAEGFADYRPRNVQLCGEGVLTRQSIAWAESIGADVRLKRRRNLVDKTAATPA
jgi:hypothetical protein